MPTINQLNTIDNPSSGDQLPIYSQSNGDARKLSLSNLLNFFYKNFVSPVFSDQYEVETEKNFTIEVNDSKDNIWLVINYLGQEEKIESCMIIIPSATNAIDGQEILINCNKEITKLSLKSDNASFSGVPESIGKSKLFLKLRFKSINKLWYCVG